jgi:hypothetical protein
MPCLQPVQQNGLAETASRSVMEMAKTNLKEENLGKEFWAEAVSTAGSTSRTDALTLVQEIKSVLKSKFEMNSWDRKFGMADYKPIGTPC